MSISVKNKIDSSQKHEWIGSRILFRKRKPLEYSLFFFIWMTDHRIKEGIVRDISAEGYILIKEDDFGQGRWIDPRRLRILEILTDEKESIEDRSKDGY